MESVQLNRDRLDYVINYLNNSLDVKIFIGQKIKLISMFHNILELYDQESIFVSAFADRIVVRIEIKDRTLTIPPKIKDTIRMYSGVIRMKANVQEIILSTQRKSRRFPRSH